MESGEQTRQRPTGREGTREGSIFGVPGEGDERPSRMGTACPERGKEGTGFGARGAWVQGVDVLSPRPRAARPGKAEGLRARSTTPATQNNAHGTPRSLQSFECQEFDS